MLVWQTVSFVIITHLLACISPGPDFAVVTRNTIRFGRSIGLLTVVGISTGILMHATYCAFGLAEILIRFPKIFLVVRYLGGGYLMFIGTKSLLFKKPLLEEADSVTHKGNHMTSAKAFWQGFGVNATNPKCIFFIFSLFILVAKLKSIGWDIFFIIEMSLTTALWFSLVVYLFSHHRIKPILVKFQKPISRGLGVFLIFFGLHLILGG